VSYRWPEALMRLQLRRVAFKEGPFFTLHFHTSISNSDDCNNDNDKKRKRKRRKSVVSGLRLLIPLRG
jgi:hypothetical protein